LRFFIATKLFAAVFTESASLSNGDIFTTFGSNRPLQAWPKSHALGSGGHQTDSKRASVLANEASMEVENRQNCLTHEGIEGHYRIGFRRPSQAGRIQTFVLSQQNQ
jgi:hypothetical protein